MPKAPTAKRSHTDDGSFTVRGKRANGEGSVYYDPTNRCWWATYRVPGERRERKVRAKTQRAATEKRDDVVARGGWVSRASRFSKATTVHELAEWWLANVAVDRVRPSSHGALTTRLTRARLGDLADIPVVELASETVQEWQSKLLHREKPLAPSTMADTRATLQQVIEAAVDHGLIVVNPVAKVKPPKVTKRPGRHLATKDTKALVTACSGSRYGLVVRFLFAQGWRVSEVLGLAWQDLDLDAPDPTAILRRAVVQVRGKGRMLGPPKSERAEGVHYLTPEVVRGLREHRAVQREERLTAGPAWQHHEYDDAPIDLVFTTPDGGLAARQAIDKLMRSKAADQGIDAKRLGTHVGRRTVVTTLFESGADLDDIANHVGHASTKTTAGYVASRGDRPKHTAALAAKILDVAAT